MTRDDIMKLLQECGYGTLMDYPIMTENMMRFAALVAAHEREECAKLCDEKYEAVPKNDPYAEADGDYSELIYATAAQDCAEEIRARGEV